MSIGITNSIFSGIAGILFYKEVKKALPKASGGELKQDIFVHALTTPHPNDDEITQEISKIQKQEGIGLTAPDIAKLVKNAQEEAALYERIFKQHKKFGADQVGLHDIELSLESKKKFLAILEKYSKSNLSLNGLSGALDIERIKSTLKLDALERQKLVLEHGSDKDAKAKLAKLYDEIWVSQKLIKDLTQTNNKITRYNHNKSLMRVRAYTNLTGNSDVIKSNLPYYQSIANNPAAVKTYDALLAKILTKTDLKFSNASIDPSKHGLGEDLDSLTTSDLSGKYMMADHLISLAENDPAYLDKLLDYKGGLKVRIVPKMSSRSDTGTWYDSTQNMLVFSYESVYRAGMQPPPNLKLFLSGNLDSLNDYLPYRESLMGNKEKLQEHDRFIEELKNSLDIKFISAKADISLVGDVSYKKANEIELDDTNKLIMAAVIAEYGSNRELLNNALKARGGLKIRFVKGYNGTMADRAAGVYDDDRHALFVTVGLNYGFNFTQKLHEFAHALDGADDRTFTSDRVKNPHAPAKGKGVGEGFVTLFRSLAHTDGFLSNGGGDHFIKFKKVRQKLYNRYHDYYGKVGVMIARINLDDKPHSVIPGVGLTHYCFRTEEEFLATTVQIFYQNPTMLLANKDTLDLYKTYAKLFKYDPLGQLAQDNKQSKKKAA